MAGRGSRRALWRPDARAARHERAADAWSTGPTAGVIKITGPDRLSWLHSLTSQHLERLSPGSTQQALVLSPQGHLEHHLTLTDDGAATWIHVEPHTAAALVEYLNSMRFMLRVEVEDLSGALAVATIARRATLRPVVRRRGGERQSCRVRSVPT